MAHVNTVLGPISPDQLGLTAMHEHLLWGLPGWQYDPKWSLSLPRAFESCEAALRDFASLGGATFVDLSGIGLGRDVEFYVEVARRAGVHVVACTGLWAKAGILGYLATRDVDFHEELYVRELTRGMGTTNVKAGIIKVGTTSHEPMSPIEEVTYRAAARAARKTGAAVTTHGVTAGPLQLDLFQQEGLDLDRVIIGHCDARYALDLERDKAMARRGAYVGYDHIGSEEACPMPYAMPDADRVALVKAMVDAGYRDNLILSCDAFCVTVGWSMPGHTVAHLLRSFVPALRAGGLDDDTIHHLLVANPRRVLPLQ